MKNTLMAISTLIKVVLFIVFMVRIGNTLAKQQPYFKRKALIQFFTMVGIIFGMSVIEFFVFAYLF